MHLISQSRVFLFCLQVKSSTLDKEDVIRAVRLLLEAEASANSPDSALRVIDAFVIPKFCYQVLNKIFTEYVMPYE